MGGKAEELDPLLIASKLGVDGTTTSMPAQSKGEGGWKEMLGPAFTAILCFPMLLAH